MRALDFVEALEAGEPSIRPDPSQIETGRVLFNPLGLKDGGPQAIAAGIRKLLGGSG